MTQFITPVEAARLVGDDMTLAVSGHAGFGTPDGLFKALHDRYDEEGHPRNVTLVKIAGTGDGGQRGGDRLAADGLIGTIITSHFGMEKKLADKVAANQCLAYVVPAGTILALYRAIAAGHKGVWTDIGLHTLADPRLDGSKANEKTVREGKDIVRLVSFDGDDYLYYPTFPIQVCFIRGSLADEDGNISLQREAMIGEQLEVAEATHNSGGIVVVQVEKIVKGGTLDPKLVKVPGIYVDYVVQVDDETKRQQSFDCEYDPSLTGETTIPVKALDPAPLNAKKVIARRAALLLLNMSSEAVINLGIGIPELVSSVANEEGIGDSLTMTVEAGAIGGVPLGGVRFGASVNAEAYMDQATQFDFYDGGGLDLTCLGLAECDKEGNINVSKFGTRIAGCGGFVNITQNTKNVVFCGTFTTGKLREEIKDGELHILQEGKVKKFVPEVGHITFSGNYARKHKQHVLYITERAVFEMKEDGVHLTEIAPGIDLQKDVLDQMGFTPIIDEVKVMPAFLFEDKPMGLKKMKEEMNK